MTKTLVWLCAICLVFSADTSLASSAVGKISKIGDATHFELSGLKQWNYEVKSNTKNKVEMLVPAFDDKTLVDLQAWSDSLIQSIVVHKDGPDGQFRVILTLTNDRVESFDYLTDDPSRLIVDFFRSIEPKKNRPPKNLKAANPDRRKKVEEKTSKKKSIVKNRDFKKIGSGRQPAGDEFLKVDPGSGIKIKEEKYGFPKVGVYDAGDSNFDRFRIKDYEINEAAIIRSQQNFYLHFPMLQMPASRLTLLLENPPEYVIKPKETKENKEARLLLKLYEKNRDAVFLKTYNYFANQYPQSDYLEIAGHLAAEVFYRMWKQSGKNDYYNMAMDKYRQLIEKYPDSPLAERTELLIGYSNLEKKRSVESIQDFYRYLKRYPGSSEKDQVYKALAESYLTLNKFDRAESYYRKIIQKPGTIISGIEARFRVGDVHFKAKKYKKAAKEYRKALAKYEKFDRRFPNIHYNLAESLFWLGKQKESLTHFIKFVERHPRHPHGGFALTRIGELLEILGADKSRVMGAFLESYFRFRESSGASVARVRLLSQRMKGMKEKELKKTLEELHHIAESTKVLSRIEEFVTLMESSGFHGRGEYKKALDGLIGYYRDNTIRVHKGVFTTRILGNISDLLKKELSKNEYMMALRTHGKYGGTWLRKSKRVDIPYFEGRAYELAGVFENSEKIYKQVKNRMSKIKGTREFKERSVNENLPSMSTVNLRLAAVSMFQRKYADAYDYLKETKDSADLSPQQQVERVIIASRVSEERGDPEKARQYVKQLVDEWQGDLTYLAGAHYHFAKLSHKVKKYHDALKALEAIQNIKSEGNQVDSEIWAKAKELAGDVYLGMGKKVSAVDSYLSYLSEFESERNLANIRFKAGNIIFETGDVKRAEKIWSAMDPERDRLFVQIANEKIANTDWEQNYKKYIDRIPAMSKMKKRSRKK